MRLRLAVPALVLLLVACRDPVTPPLAPVATEPAASAAWTAPSVTSSVHFVRPALLREFRLLAPARAWRGPLALRIEGGRPLAQAGWGDAFTAEVSATAADGRSAHAILTVAREDLDEPPASRREAWLGTAQLDTSDWPDGPFQASARLRRPLGGELRLTATGAITRSALAAVPAGARDEVAAWFDECNRQTPIWGRLPTWDRLDAVLANAAAGAADPFDGVRGFVLRSASSPVLQRQQPYTVYIPPGLSLLRPVPLLLLLHGSGGDFRNVIPDAYGGQDLDEHPMLIANAGAFRYQEYRHMALQDALAVLEHVCRVYPVDPERIYLQGISLGGRGTLDLAARLRDRVAAVSAQGVYGMLADDGVRGDALAAAYHRRQDLRELLPNLVGLPVELIAGSEDRNTPAEQADLFARLLRAWGSTAEQTVVRRFPTGHGLTMPHYDWRSTRCWLLQQRRSEALTRDRVHLVAHDLRFASQAWLAIEQAMDPAEPVAVHGLRWAGETSLAPGSSTGAVVLALWTRNVAALTLRQAVHLGEPAPPLIDGVPCLVPWQRQDECWRLRLQRHGHDWRLAEGVELRGKSARRNGPLVDVWNTPIVHVWDDSDPAQAARLERAARTSARWDLQPPPESLPVLPLSALDAAQRQGRSVVLHTGRGRDCPLLVGLDLPEPLDRPAVAGELRLALRPAPWADDRYLVIADDHSNDGINLQHLGWPDQGLQADWLRLRSETGVRGLRLLAAGTYDNAWRPARRTEQDFRAKLLLGPAAGGW
jgi:dienelactone hydrolase